MLRVWGLGFRSQGSGFRFSGLKFRVQEKGVYAQVVIRKEHLAVQHRIRLGGSEVVLEPVFDGGTLVRVPVHCNHLRTQQSQAAVVERIWNELDSQGLILVLA